MYYYLILLSCFLNIKVAFFLFSLFCGVLEHCVKHYINIMYYYCYYYKVLKTAERVIRQASTMQAEAPKVSTVLHIVRGEIGTEDVFLLGEHIEETQFGIDNHHSDLLSLVVSVFHKIRLHHIAKLASLELQKGSTRKKLCKTVLFQGF